MHYLKHLVQHLEREILNKIPQGLFYYFFTTIYYYFFSGFGSTVRHFPYRFLKNSKKKKKKNSSYKNTSSVETGNEIVKL